MTKLTSVLLVALLAVLANPAFATNRSGGDCNGVHNCNSERTYNTDNSRTYNDNSRTNYNTDLSRTTNNSYTDRSRDNYAAGGQGGTGVGVGVGIADGGDARATGGDASSRSSANGGAVYGSGNSHSLNLQGQQTRVNTGDVDASSRNLNANLNRTGDQSQRVSTGDVNNRLSNDSTSRSGVLASGNSFNHVDAGDSTSRSNASTGDQSQFGLNLSDNDNRSRAVNGDVSGSNTLIIGGQGEGQGEGFGSTLSPESNSRSRVGDTTATTGDQTNTQTSSIDGNNSSVGDINVTVEGLSDEAARSLGQPDVVEVDSRDLSTENIDASTTINDNSVYEATEATAASVAPSFASICTSGASGQGRAYGVSLAVTSDQCAHLMQADAYMALGMRDEAIKHVKRAGAHVNNKGFWGHIRHVLSLGML